MILLRRLQARNFKQLAEVSLCFPPEGSILIEGLNEAGKSSLFEAIFFALYGETLLTEKESRIEHLRRYGAEEMRVELDFLIEGRPFVITRRVGANHTASLECPAADGARETIRPLRAIGARLKEELKLSRSALLNTCFVEQKGLERLESLNKKDRGETINELLNLRVLTQLRAEYRVERKDADRLQDLARRVELARLDAAQPELIAQEHHARSCLAFRRWLECREALSRLAAEFATLQTRQEANRTRRAEIETELERAERLKHHLRSLEGDLTLHVRAWNDGLRQRGAAADQVAELQKLARRIPAHETQLRRWEHLYTRLEQVVALEGEALRAEAELQDAISRQDDRQQVDQAWQSGERERNRLSAQHREAESALAEARRQLTDRRAAIVRDGHFARLAQHAESWLRASQGAEERRAELFQAEQEAAALENARSCLTTLEAAFERHRQDELDGRTLEGVESRLKTCREKQAEAAETVSRIEHLGEQLAHQDMTLTAARSNADQARRTLREAHTRAVLLHWAEAAERCAEADPDSGRHVELTEKQTKARAEFEGAQARERTVGGLRRTAVIVAVLAAVLAISGLALPQMAAPAIGGLVVMVAAIAGASLLTHQLGGVWKAVTAARSVLDRLEGEENALATQVRAAAAQRKDWAARERRWRGELTALGIAIPPSPAEARKQTDRLPDLTVEAAQERSRAADGAATDATGARQITEGLLRAEKSRLAAVDRLALDAEILALHENHKTLVRRRHTASADTAVLREAGMMARGGPERTLKALRSQVARSQAAKDSIPGIQDRHRKQVDAVRTEHALALQLARELNLGGDDPPAWSSAARDLRTAFIQECDRIPTAVLETHETSARTELDEIRQAEARLDETQLRRRAELDRNSAQDLVLGVTAYHVMIAKNAAAQQPLQDVRPTLEDASLPTEPASLQACLAAERQKLASFQQQAARLPAAQEALRQREMALGTQYDQLASAWNTHLQVPVPPTPGEAEVLLARAQKQAQHNLAALNEPNLRAEDGKLAQAASQLTGLLATTRHRQAEAQEQEITILNQLATLTISVEGGAETVVARHPELAAVPARTLPEWEQEVEARVVAVRTNRSDRGVRAQALGVGEDPLDLGAEQQALAAAELELAVRRRADEIVDRTRAAIVERVMPLTMQNMQQLLPLLTDGRYQQAEWNEQDNTLSVFDHSAGGLQHKRVFSGGARDQISLALRLAFALATLPGEHNVRPGWLFLDEPLSSFDHRRTQDLVDLLTRGLIRRQFPQVFLISHSQSFDPGQFDHRLRMEAGRVVESTLPTFGEAAR